MVPTIIFRAAYIERKELLCYLAAISHPASRVWNFPNMERFWYMPWVVGVAAFSAPSPLIRHPTTCKHSTNPFFQHNFSVQFITFGINWHRFVKNIFWLKINFITESKYCLCIAHILSPCCWWRRLIQILRCSIWWRMWVVDGSLCWGM